MRIELHLSEKELKEAIKDWARSKGHDPKLVFLNHIKGDRPGEPSYFSATIRMKEEPSIGETDNVPDPSTDK